MRVVEFARARKCEVRAFESPSDQLYASASLWGWPGGQLNTSLNTESNFGDKSGQYAKVDHLDFGEIYAYEVDGFGNRVFWDDANVPSLMSLAYLGVYESNDPIYARTRQFLLSVNNPYSFRGTAAEG